MTVRPIFAAALAGGVLLACAKKPAPPAAATSANVVTVTASDFAFAAPDTIPAGLTTLKLENHGQEVHQLVLIRIDSGKTMADLAGMMKNPNAPIPGWVTFPLGVGGITPTDSANSTATLPAGHYAMVCFLPSPDGTPHVAKGMVRQIEIVASAAAVAPEPAPDLVITMKDYTWELSAPPTAGTHIMRVENVGPQLHEIQMFQMAPGKSAKDLMGWIQTMKGPPPGKPVGGYAGLAPGLHGFFTTTFAPGMYVFLCYVPDKKDNKPHMMHGMVKEITVS